MPVAKPRGTVNRRQVLKLVGAGGLWSGVAQLPARGTGANIAGLTGVPREADSLPATDLPWYGQDLVRGHLSWLHPTWTRPEKDFDAKRWIDQFERAGFRSFVFYSRFHDGVCNWPSYPL